MHEMSTHDICEFRLEFFMSWKSLGKFIRYKREALGLSRDEFDTTFHIAAGTLRNLEGGHSNFSSTQLLEFAKIFEMKPGLLADLLGDAVTYEEAVLLDSNRGSTLGEGEDLESKRFVRMPKNFSEMDGEFIEGIAGLLSEFIERSKQSRNKDTWLEDRKEAG